MERGVEWMVAPVTWIKGLIQDFDGTLVMQGKAGYSSYTFDPGVSPGAPVNTRSPVIKISLR